MRLVLASASPRRQALVALLGLAWRAAPSDVPEDDYLLPEPLVGALNVAAAKARATRRQTDDELVLAADTLVVADGKVLGKPGDAEHALTMLSSLRGRAHTVLTGVVLDGGPERAWGGVVASRVLMRAYSRDEMHAYIARGEPFDKAGGYAVQDAEFAPVAHLDGCYLNVVGLPLCAAEAGLEALGISPSARPAHRAPPCAYCRAGEATVRSGS